MKPPKAKTIVSRVADSTAVNVEEDSNGPPVISSMEDRKPARSAFKDDGDIRLFSGSDTSDAGGDEFRMFKDN